MPWQQFVDFGLPGLGIGAAAWLLYALIKRGFSIHIDVGPTRVPTKSSRR